MKSVLIASVLSIAVCLIAAVSAERLLQLRQHQAADVLLQQRRAQLAQALERWQHAAGPAQQAMAEEARRTIELLEQVYAQEDRLWTYYSALDESVQQRSALANEKARLVENISRHELRLHSLEQDLDRLRPHDAQEPISFTSQN